jgi:hypothetical protein
MNYERWSEEFHRCSEASSPAPRAQAPDSWSSTTCTPTARPTGSGSSRR